jgi:LysR family glycine cleavage system transcriptional activator
LTDDRIAPLPPVQALRALEAAARHLSYSRAAKELSLTHGAVSHHIARLEQDLGGQRLFVRDGQRMMLTDAGQILVMEVRQGLRILAAAFESARSRPRKPGETTGLTVSVLPSFAAHWLVPRISRFQSKQPNIDISIRPSAALASMNGQDGVDMAIRYGPGRWAGVTSELLMKSFIFPVCSPSLLARTALATPTDLAKVTLLRNPRQMWRPWFLAADLKMPEPVHGPIYDDAGLLLQAAAEGQGVALARRSLAADHINAGRLVRLFDIEIEDEYSWFLVWREPPQCNPNHLDIFRRWLRMEAANDED